jgi:hypothetical protein
MKFIVEDTKGMNLNIRLISSNSIEIEGKDLEVRVILEDMEVNDGKSKEYNTGAIAD